MPLWHIQTREWKSVSKVYKVLKVLEKKALFPR
jgi:hypothetical protein